jgi:hypothetical protein
VSVLVPGITADKCRACGAEAAFLWAGIIIDVAVRYFECPKCGYVQTERPYWLDRAYATAINDSDTGILVRNLSNANLVLATLWLLGARGGRVVDYAGGYGILVRLLRDYGVDAWWSDPFCDNLLARGFQRSDQTASLVTAFEAFEHFVEPEHEFEKMLAIGPNVLLSTLLIPRPAPEHANWWYYGAEHGQHVGLFREDTLRAMARRHGKRLVSNGAFYHLITDEPVNALLWKLLIRASTSMPSAFRRGLNSKTWSDHQVIAKR